MRNNALYEFRTRVWRNARTVIPPHFAGLQIVVYVVAMDQRRAQAQMLEKMLTDGYQLADADPPALELIPEQWDSYVERLWPGMKSALPSRAEVLARMASPTVFFGATQPFE